MLDVVIQGASHVGDVAECHRDEGQPVIVEIPAGAVRERQSAVDHTSSKKARRAHDRVRDQERGKVRVVVASPVPQRFRAHVSAGVDPSQIAVGQVSRTHRRPQGLELVRVPAIVVIAESDELGFRRNHAQGTLEVPVETQVPFGTREDEPPVPGNGFGYRLEPLRRRAVVADQADPVAVGLGADRLHLVTKELDVGVEGGHADRDQRPLRRYHHVLVRGGLGPLADVRSCQGQRSRSSRGEPGLGPQLKLARPRLGLQLGSSPKSRCGSSEAPDRARTPDHP